MSRGLDNFKITLKAARVNAGLTQKEVAAKMRVSNNTVLNWEKGSVKPSLSTLAMLCSIYKVSEDNIFLPLD